MNSQFDADFSEWFAIPHSFRPAEETRTLNMDALRELTDRELLRVARRQLLSPLALRSEQRGILGYSSQQHSLGNLGSA